MITCSRRQCRIDRLTRPDHRVMVTNFLNEDILATVTWYGSISLCTTCEINTLKGRQRYVDLIAIYPPDLLSSGCGVYYGPSSIIGLLLPSADVDKQGPHGSDNSMVRTHFMTHRAFEVIRAVACIVIVSGSVRPWENCFETG